MERTTNVIPGQQQLLVSSNLSKAGPPAGEALCLSLQEGGALLLVGSSLADTLGTLLEAFHVRGISTVSSLLTPGFILITIGGGSGIAGLAIFIAGHLRDSKTAVAPTSPQQESGHYLTKEDLIKFSTYGAFYSCALGGLLDTGGTLVEILRKTGPGALMAQLGKGLLITSSVFNAAGLLLVFGEGAVYLSHSLSEYRKKDDTDSATPSEATALQTPEPVASSSPPEQSTIEVSRAGWNMIKTLNLLGGTLFAVGGLLDSTGTLTTNLSGAPADNSTKTDNSTGYFVLSFACATSFLGLGAVVAARVIEKYRQTSTNSEVVPSLIENADNSEEESAEEENVERFSLPDTDLYQYAMQSGNFYETY